MWKTQPKWDITVVVIKVISNFRMVELDTREPCFSHTHLADWDFICRPNFQEGEKINRRRRNTKVSLNHIIIPKGAFLCATMVWGKIRICFHKTSTNRDQWISVCLWPLQSIPKPARQWVLFDLVVDWLERVRASGMSTNHRPLGVWCNALDDISGGSQMPYISLISSCLSEVLANRGL